jgi:hypothetical protein
VPRVVPSDVVRAIDRMFPWAAAPTAPGQSSPSVGSAHLPAVAAIVALAGQVSDEFLILPPDEYSELVSGLAAMRAAIEAWQSGIDPYRTFLGEIAGYGNLHPLTLVRQNLALCPDEATSPGTAELAYIADVGLRDSIRLDISAANQNLAQGEWKGATVLAGSAVEALLLWALQEHENRTPHAVAGAVAALRGGKTLKRDPGPDLEGQGWHLHEYIEVAAHLKIIKPDAAAQVRLAKDASNLVHPGRSARLREKCDRFTALTALAAVEAVVRDLTPP